MQKIDTHQHLPYPDRFNYSWAQDFPALQGAFDLEGYRAAAADCDIQGTLFMEVDVDAGLNPGEADFFSQIASDPANQMLGIVAKLLAEEAGFEEQLDLIRHPSLKGVRRVLHTQPDALSQTTRFRENVVLLGKASLNFDLCVTQAQLPIALELAQACPEVSFILDHCGGPDIAAHTSTDCESWQQWQSGIRALGSQANVTCKFSGITVYATPEQRTVEGLSPYLTEILESFGTSRIVWGGDWPVCNLADGLLRWSQLTDAMIADLSTDEQQDILSNNARRVYAL